MTEPQKEITSQATTNSATAPQAKIQPPAKAQPKGNIAALLPIGVFLILYLGLGILFEYGLNIPMGFYNIPIVVIFLEQHL